MKTVISFCLGAGAMALVAFGNFEVTDRVSDIPKLEEQNPSVDFKLVPVADLIQDLARYKRTHADAIDARLQSRGQANDASRSCLYSLDKLRTFIDFVESSSRRGGIPNTSTLAIRFFFGVYPLGQKIGAENYQSLHTLFMVPAYYDEKTKKFIEFDPISSATQAYKNRINTLPYSIADLADLRDSTVTALILDATAFQVDSKMKFQKMSAAPQASAMNQGQLCPPNCPDQSLLDYVDRKYPSGKDYSRNTAIVE